jgi:DNA-binding IclR family transcriptional regulator
VNTRNKIVEYRCRRHGGEVRVAEEVLSPPTARALDVVELLARRQDKVSLTEVAQELDQSVSTARAILHTLCQRGWAVRDPESRLYALGPSAARLGEPRSSGRSLEVAVRAAAQRLSSDLGAAVSIVEIVGGHLDVTVVGQTGMPAGATLTDTHAPFVAPFGMVFAAWATPDEQEAWIRRGVGVTAAVAERYGEVLTATRARGFGIERLSSPITEALAAIGKLDLDALSGPVSEMVDRLLVEITTFGFVTDEDRSGGRAAPVTGVYAPVRDANGRVAFTLGTHPFRAMSDRQIASLGRRLMRAADAVQRVPV